MTTINADEVRIPKPVRDAVARHERVVVLNREHPVLAIVHPDDLSAVAAVPRGIRVRDLSLRLAAVPAPDEAFADDMAMVLGDVGVSPGDPWARS